MRRIIVFGRFVGGPNGGFGSWLSNSGANPTSDSGRGKWTFCYFNLLKLNNLVHTTSNNFQLILIFTEKIIISRSESHFLEENSFKGLSDLARIENYRMKRLSLKFFNLAHVTIMAAGVLVSPESGASVVVLDDPPILRVKTVANPENGHTYHLISGEATPQNPLGGVTWSAADAYAKSLSSDRALSGLVSINNPAEQSWLTTHFPAILSGQGYRHQVIWIGLNDRNHEGIFCWENGEKVEHTNWAINLPNDPDGSEDFVYLTNTSMFDPFIPQGTWNDHYDESTFFGEMPFSAIIEVQPIPEPSSALLVCFPAFAFLRRRR
jgi:hypothetical protein